MHQLNDPPVRPTNLRWQATLVMFVGMASAHAEIAPAPSFATVGSAEFESVLAPDQTRKLVELAGFEMATVPVTNLQFLDFVKANPKWQRGKVANLFADERYLENWASPTDIGELNPDQPVTRVSWFAARAYCKANNARLPTWYEWEWTAAADRTRRDARDDPRWRQQMLNWYAQTGDEPRSVGAGPSNVYGIYDIHDLVWEWVEDFGGMIVSADNREQGDPDLLKFCGAGAITMERREDYAVLMRIAMLSSLEARFATSNVGFRCARDL